ncbi:MAG TPA: hypothetical protein VNA04_17070 [Thermoanaerobaculia bacterium]|nr:hypothetical protein [Thermoanaerobaculia bacterium]
MRKLFLGVALAAALPLSAVTVDRIAAVIDRQVLTVSEIGQMAEVRFFARTAGRSDDDYRRAILDALIAQTLRQRDVERFGAPEVPLDSIEARLRQIEDRFSTPEELEAALVRAELTLDDLRALVKRQLQVEIYIQERFAPLVFVANDEIEAYYAGPWTRQRRERGLPVVPLAEVREAIRSLLRASRLAEEIERWTNRLRLRANVDIYAWR